MKNPERISPISLSKSLGWQVLAPNRNMAHVFPYRDVVEHSHPTCHCGPDYEITPGHGLGPHVLVIHHSLDGRELLE